MVHVITVVQNRPVQVNIPAVAVIRRARRVRDVRRGEHVLAGNAISHALPRHIGMAVRVPRVAQVIFAQGLKMSLNHR